ncbi:MAG: flagellar hook-length control protein FliK [Magnetococcales bacterium]|nr:flagellar hook-length control protein FliK [Magnetococcales bacterium]
MAHMIVSGMIPRAGSSTGSNEASNLKLNTGDVLQGRVSQVRDGGSRGMFRLADGSGFNFSGARGLQEGERVRLEVVRLVPDVAFRLQGSESGNAGRMAESAEQSLIRAPELMARLVSMLEDGTKSGGTLLSGTKPSFLSFQGGTQPGQWITGKGDSLLSLLRNNLPHVSGDKLLKGDLSDLIRLLESGTRKEITEAVRNFQRAATTLHTAGAPLGSEADSAPELVAARNVMQRMGDLLAMQDILPRANLAQSDQGMFLGYRLFWLTEGGLGEAVWRREKGKKGGKGGEEEDVTSVLITLNMTQLGAVQARLSFGEGRLLVGITAEDDKALHRLRGDVGELRRSLIAAELPLHALELARMSGGEMRSARQTSLGIGGETGFSTEG